MNETLHYYATCMICYSEIYAPNSDVIHTLWTDEGWFGRPICIECFEILKELVPKKLDIQIKRKKSKKRGLEIWL